MVFWRQKCSILILKRISLHCERLRISSMVVALQKKAVKYFLKEHLLFLCPCVFTRYIFLQFSSCCNSLQQQQESHENPLWFGTKNVPYLNIKIYIIKTGVFLWTLKCTNVTSPPVLKLQDSQGYLWLPYDLTEVIKLIGVTFNQKNFFFQKNTLCHSFRIIVIPSGLLSFLPNYSENCKY